MKLFEFEAKNILKECGLPVPVGRVATTPDQAEAIAIEIGRPVAVKAQVLAAGRGKAGGIQFAGTPAEAKMLAARLLGSSIQGCAVAGLLVEEKLDVAAQLYACVCVDRQAKAYVVLASTEGGVDIEEVAQTSPDRIARHWIDPTEGFNEARALRLLAPFRMAPADASRFAAVLNTLYGIALDKDAELVETNPLVKTRTGELVAADARIIIDDNALFRHPEFEERRLESVEHTPLEIEARKQKLAYVDLAGTIGIVGNGAGLVMATVDMVHLFGGEPANFLDVGGGGNVEVTRKGVMLVMSKPQVKAVLVNILGGITRCDIVAQAVVEALNGSAVKKPVTVRMMGTNEAEGMRILAEAGIRTCPDMETAVQETLRLQADHGRNR